MSVPAERVDCSEIVLRGITRRHVDRPTASDRRCSPAAFLLRPAREERPRERFLSVHRESLLEDPLALFVRPLRLSVVLASLHCGRVRDLDLDVGAHATEDLPSHAGIEGLPHPDEDWTAAQELAATLARMARVAYERP